MIKHNIKIIINKYKFIKLINTKAIKIKYLLFLAKPYWKYGKMYALISLITAAILSPINTVLKTILPKTAIDAVVHNQTPIEIIIIIGLFTVVILLITVTQLLITQSYSVIAQMRIQYKLLLEVNERALYTDFKYYDDPEFYTQFTYAQQNYAGQAQQVMQLIPALLSSIVTSFAMGAIITSAGSVLLFITLGFVIIQTIIQLPFIKRNSDFSVNLTNITKSTNYVFRSLQLKENSAEMRTSQAGVKLLKTFDKTISEIIHYYMEHVKSTMKYIIIQGVITPFQTSIILIYIVIFIIAGDTSKIGLYASLTVAAATLSGQLSSLFSNVSNIFNSIMYGERIAKFFETVSDIETPSFELLSPPRGKYTVEFNNVSFSYKHSKFIMNNLNFIVKPGQRIAIVGENGSGKTTLTKLLLRLYDVDNGSVLINGCDIREYDIHALRQRVGIAYQDVCILAMSLRDNLTVYNEATDEELLVVIKKLGLQSVLEKSGGRLDVQISREFTENGIVLSRGEAQRIALARLFIGSFGLLLLDEPSSALDPVAENNLMQIILDKSNTATTIMIAHRLNTVRDFDLIYNMENGEIIESGTHCELMRAHGKYYNMFTKQAERYSTISE